MQYDLQKRRRSRRKRVGEGRARGVGGKRMGGGGVWFWRDGEQKNLIVNLVIGLKNTRYT